MPKVRDLLGVPGHLRAAYAYEKPKWLKGFEAGPSDFWARVRAEELAASGREVRLVRYRPDESFCVVYRA